MGKGKEKELRGIAIREIVLPSADKELRSMVRDAERELKAEEARRQSAIEEASRGLEEGQIFRVDPETVVDMLEQVRAAVPYRQKKGQKRRKFG